MITVYMDSYITFEMCTRKKRTTRWASRINSMYVKVWQQRRIIYAHYKSPQSHKREKDTHKKVLHSIMRFYLEKKEVESFLTIQLAIFSVYISYATFLSLLRRQFNDLEAVVMLLNSLHVFILKTWMFLSDFACIGIYVQLFCRHMALWEWEKLTLKLIIQSMTWKWF